MRRTCRKRSEDNSKPKAEKRLRSDMDSLDLSPYVRVIPYAKTDAVCTTPELGITSCESHQKIIEKSESYLRCLFTHPDTLLYFPPPRPANFWDDVLEQVSKTAEGYLAQINGQEKMHSALCISAQRRVEASKRKPVERAATQKRAINHVARNLCEASKEFWAPLRAEAQKQCTKAIKIVKERELHERQLRALEATEALVRTRSSLHLGMGRTVPPLNLLEEVSTGLRGYQKVGVEWLISLHDQSLSGILADEMGLGKTIQTIAFFAFLAEHRQNWGPHLVVVPMSVLLNWESEFKRWAPSLEVLSYYGTTARRAQLRKGWSGDWAANVVLVSYNTILSDQARFQRRRWRYLVLDEAHGIKNWESQRWQVLLNLHSENRLLLTGTPLQNSAMELWSLLYFLMPDSNIFDSHDDFQALYGSLTPRPEEIRRLHDILRPFMLRRLKSDVEKQLPRKFEKVILCPLSQKQRMMYNDYMRLDETKEMLASGNALGILAVLMGLRKVCNHPRLFAARTADVPYVMSPSVLAQYRCCCERLHGMASTKDILLQLSSTRNILYHPLSWLYQEEAHSPPKIPVESYDISKVEELACETLHFPFTHPELESYVDEYKSRKRQERELRSLASLKRSADHFRLINIWDAPPRMFFSCTQKVMFGDRNLCSVPLIHGDHDVAREIFPLLDQIPVTHKRCIASNSFAMGSSKIVEAEKMKFDPLNCAHQFRQEISRRHCLEDPGTRGLIFESGKLQVLSILLPQLHAQGHKCLIFTQFTKVLDILQEFLTGLTLPYVRLDGKTPVRDRHRLVTRFNNNSRIFAFILSTRSGGLGLNLTAADTVVFYDSDWNPTVDLQAQDRCHRIGQARDVTIYRLVSEHTVEERILLRARQKRRLNHLVLRTGRFDTLDPQEWSSDFGVEDKDSASVLDFFQDFPGVEDGMEKAERRTHFEDLLRQVEDMEDQDISTSAQISSPFLGVLSRYGLRLLCENSL